MENVKKQELEEDWSDEPTVEAVTENINDWDALSDRAFYRGDNSRNVKEFKSHCESFIADAEKELEKFKQLVAKIKVD